MATRKIERKVKASREITIRLHGWPARTTLLNSYDACWMVDLEFSKPAGNIISLNHFTTDDYETAFQKYEALKIICEN